MKRLQCAVDTKVLTLELLENCRPVQPSSRCRDVYHAQCQWLLNLGWITILMTDISQLLWCNCKRLMVRKSNKVLQTLEQQIQWLSMKYLQTMTPKYQETENKSVLRRMYCTLLLDLSIQTEKAHRNQRNRKRKLSRISQWKRFAGELDSYHRHFHWSWPLHSD